MPILPMKNENEKWFPVQNGDRIDIHTKDEQGFEQVVCYGVRNDEDARLIVSAKTNEHKS